jgi:Rrf2 family protein
MLQINRKTDYAVRVILALARHPQGTRLATGVIQREMLIPQAFLPRIVAQLANAGLVKTYPGRDGGLELPHHAESITLKDVVEVFEGPLLLSECMESHGADDCPFRGGCPVSSKWGRVQAAMVKEMDSITFKDLADEAIEMAGIRSGNHTRRGTRGKK